MKKRLIIDIFTFILIFAFIYVAAFFFYNRVVENLSSSVGSDNMSIINKRISYEINDKLEKDVVIFSDYVDKYFNEADILTALETNKQDLLNSGIEVVGFGTVDQNVYKIDDVLYYGKTATSDHPDYYEQPVAIFNFVNNTEFELKNNQTPNIANKKFLIFQIKNYFIYIDAEDYFNPFYNDSEIIPKNQFYIVSGDGVSYYGYTGSDNLFFEQLRKDNSSFELDKVKNMLNSGQAGVIANIIFNNEKYYVTSSPVPTALSNNKLNIVQMFSYTTVTSTLSNILVPMGILLAVLVVIFMFGIFILYFLIIRRNNDVVSAKFIHYFDKTFAIKVNSKGKITYINAATKRYLLDLKNGVNIKDLKTLEKYEDNVEKVFTQNSITFILKGKEEDEVRYVWFIPTVDFSSRYLVGMDVTEQELQKQFLTKQALYNANTGLPNWEKLKDDLQKHLDILKKTDAETEKNTLILFDIDKFKQYNQLFSHRMGNAVLTKTAEVLKQLVEKLNANATLYNMNQDLFAIMIKEVDDYDKIVAWVKESIDFFIKPIEIDNNMLVITIYYGIFNYTIEEYPYLVADQAIENALRTLQKAKSYSNQQFESYSLSVSRFISKEQVIENDLRIAIEKKEFVMFLQPQYDTDKNKISGFEALIRWDNPKYKSQSPAEYIEIAEKNNMIIEVGRIVLESSVQIAKEFEPYGITISLNISPVQLMQAGFVSEILSYMEIYEVNPKNIAIEITETFLMENFELVVEKLKILKNRGFGVHLDDFGTGYSSMLYLKELPIDTIKIDKEFIRYINNDKFSRVIVSKIISMAKSLELEVIAEGVEDEKQSQFLSKNGCNIIQGYLISKAIPLNEARDLLEHHNQKKETTSKASKTK